MKRKLILATAFAGIALPAIGLVQANAEANNRMPSESQMALAAPVKLDQAGQIALKEVPGTLARISFNDENGAGVYEASLIGTVGEVTHLRIDAQSGKVLGKRRAGSLSDYHEQGGDQEQTDGTSRDQNGDGEDWNG